MKCRILIAGQPYTVETKAVEKHRDLQECLGITYPDECSIVIRKNLKAPKFLEVLVHEMLHGVMAVSGVPVLMGWKADEEEKIISIMSPTIADLLTRNFKTLGRIWRLIATSKTIV